MNTTTYSVGDTPLLSIDGVFAKNESVNPSGSIKDRMAKRIIEEAEKEGLLTPGQEIVELTTGNTGIALATFSAIKGYRFIAMIPDNMTIERIKRIKALGARVKLIPARNDMKYAKVEFEKEKKRNPKAFYPLQFENPNNYLSYYQLADELLTQVSYIDYFVAGAGTGGTIIGVGQRLKSINPNTKIIVIEPEEALVLSASNRVSKPHEIFGIGEGFVPKIISENRNVIDDVHTVNSKTAIETMKYLWHKKGVFVGVSSGANLYVAQQIKREHPEAVVATVFPDSGDRYLSIV